MKSAIFAALAGAALVGGPFSAEACNPMLNKDFGRHVAPVVLPATMLARNHPETPSPKSIVGLWHDVHIASDGTLFLEYDSWYGSGTETELGKLPPAGGDVCMGVWTKQGHTILLTAHVGWVYDLNNNFQGTLDFTEKNQVAADGKLYTGTFEARFFDPNGVKYLDVTGTTVADRIVW